MEEEFEEIEVEYAPLCEGNEIDFEYEFDAPQFYDFKHQETFWNASEAEQWFKFAPSYPPSPFLLNKRRGKCSASMDTKQVSSIEEENITGVEYCNETLNGKTKALSKSSSSKSKDFSFMKPTASHLAKQKNPSEVQTPPQSLRIQRQNSNSSSTDIGQPTKRQKLEAGYLRKVARLKHHIFFTHKKTKEVDCSDTNLGSKSNVSTAKKPNLVTALRAQRQKSKSNAESSVPTQSSSSVPKAKPSNKKNLEGPTQIYSKMKSPRSTEFQVFHLRTSHRAMQNTYNSTGSSLNSDSISNNETRDIKSVGSKQEKCGTNNKLQCSRHEKLPSKTERGVFRNIKVHPLELIEEKSLKELPTNFFSKLSLTSKVKQTTKSRSKEQQFSKGLKENNNRPGFCFGSTRKLDISKK